jgi:hypothetical protein
MAQFSLRELELKSLDEAVAEAARLLDQGYRQVGNWNLAQILGHCSDWLRFPMDGYPPAKFPMSLILGFVRLTMGKALYRKVIRHKGFKPGSPTMPTTIKSKDSKRDADAFEDFVSVVQRFKDFRGTLHPSPLFGQLTYDQHQELQIIHLRHHLRFLVPADPPTPTEN